MFNISLAKLKEKNFHLAVLPPNWEEKMFEYIYWVEETESVRGRYRSVYFDLVKTKKLFEEACSLLYSKSKRNSKFLFVSTEPRFSNIVKTEAQRCGINYVNSHWLNGMLTNWGTIQYRIERLNFLETQEQTKEFEQLSKKKKQKLTRELTHLRKYFDGVKDLKERPNVIVICNARHEINVIQEAQILNIPVIALVDITVDPSLISFPIPATPHLKHTVDYLLQKSANCILAGKLNKKK